MRSVKVSPEQMNKHGEKISAYLKGARIQFKTDAGIWKDCAIDECGGPEWDVKKEYRVYPWTNEQLEKHGDLIRAWDNGRLILISVGDWWTPLTATLPKWGAPVEDYRISVYTIEEWAEYENIIKAHEHGAIIEKIAQVPAGTPGFQWERLNISKDCAIDFKEGYSYRVSPWNRAQLVAHGKVIRAWEMGEDVEKLAHTGKFWPVNKVGNGKPPAFDPSDVYRVKPVYNFEYMGESIHDMTEERAKEVYAILLNVSAWPYNFKDRKATLQDLEKFINGKWPGEWYYIFTGACGCCTLNVAKTGKCYLNGITPAVSGRFNCDDGNHVFVNEEGKLTEEIVINNDNVHISKDGLDALRYAVETVAQINEKRESLQTLALKIATCRDPEAKRRLQKRFDEMATNTKQFETGGVVQVQDSFIYANEEDAKRLRDEFKEAMLKSMYGGKVERKRTPFYEQTYNYLVPHDYVSFRNSQALRFKKGEAVRTLLEYNASNIFLGVPGASGMAITYQQLFDEYTDMQGEPCGQWLNTGFFGLPEAEQRKITRDHVTALTKAGRTKELKELFAALDANSLSTLKADKLEFFVKQLDKMLC